MYPNPVFDVLNISKKDINALNAELSITLSPIDYEDKVENAIKKAQKQAKNIRKNTFKTHVKNTSQ